MKIKSSKPDFSPITLTITMETKEEAQAIYAIFNNTRNTMLLNSNVDQSIRDAIGREYYVPSHSSNVIAHGVTGTMFFQGVRKKK